jgi:predicted amidohydrolase YtcJ
VNQTVQPKPGHGGTILVLRTLLAITLILTLLVQIPARSEQAELLLTNARIYTADPAEPWAEALAVAGGKILSVGSNTRVGATAGDHSRILDLHGAFVTPGFNDAHVHMDATGSLLTGVNLLDVHAPEPFTARIRAATERLPAGSWILRGDWGAYEQWEQGSSGTTEASSPQTGPFTPDRRLIDDFTRDHPVLVSRFNRSMYLANALALSLAGIGESTPDPVGGEIDRDPNGRLTGILRGSAVELVERVIPPMSFEQRLVGVRAVLREAREGGVTTLQDLTDAEQLRAYQALKAAGELTARIMVRPNIFQGAHVAALGISRGFGDDWLKVIGYKGWVDGIMGNSSAMFFRPYDHDPINRGILRPPMLPEAEEGAAFSLGEAQHYSRFGPGNMERLVDAWAETGVPAHIHAIGDLGNRIVLDIYERVLTSRDMVDADHRWRVIHAQVVHESDFERFGALNLVAEVNPYHVADDMRWMEERIGAERSKGAYAFRRLKDAGAVLIFGSDSPGTNAARYYLNPMYGLYAAVSRQTLSGEPANGWFPDQRLSIEEAIDAYTRAPAWASFEEEQKGTLSPGKLADIAVFDTDLIAAGRSEPARLLSAKVLYTIVGGRIVHQATPAGAAAP